MITRIIDGNRRCQIRDTKLQIPASNNWGDVATPCYFLASKLFLGYSLPGPPQIDRFGMSALRSAAHRHTLVILTFESCLGGMEQFSENIRFCTFRVIDFCEHLGGK
jgi:hypothetical protein